MLPVIATVNTPTPIQPTLVATPLPNNHALRVPVDNVPPPVSTVQINNNARGNNNGPGIAEEEISAAAPPAENAASPPLGRLTNASTGAPATFLAQLIGQDVPPAVQATLQGVLAEYEKMVVFSYVKYKPSNATLPPPAPVGIFGRILQQEKTTAPVKPVEIAPTEEPQPTPVAVSAAAAAAPKPAAAPPRHIVAHRNQPTSPQNDTIVLASAPPPTAVISAYAATTARNATLPKADAEASV